MANMTKEEITALFGQVGRKSYTLVCSVTDEVMDFLTLGPKRTANTKNGPMWVRDIFWSINDQKFETACWSQVGEKFAVGGTLVFRPQMRQNADGTYEVILDDKGQPTYTSATFCPEEEEE